MTVPPPPLPPRPGCSFRYSDPIPGFDRSKVKGVVARLVHVLEHPATSVALEVAAGGKLYQVLGGGGGVGGATGQVRESLGKR